MLLPSNEFLTHYHACCSFIGGRTKALPYHDIVLLNYYFSLIAIIMFCHSFDRVTNLAFQPATRTERLL